MKMHKNCRLVSWVMAFSLALLMLIPLSAVVSASSTSLTVSAPAVVQSGQSFMVNLNVGGVTNLNSFQFDLTYDNSVIQIAGLEGGTGVSGGVIGSTAMPLNMWGFIPSATPGHVRAFGNLPNAIGVTGQGYLAQIQFNVVGSAGQHSNLGISAVELVDTSVATISTSTAGAVVTVAADSGAAAASVSPPASNVTMGTSFIVSLNIEAVANLNSFQFDLAYDNTVVQVASAEGGVAVSDGLVGVQAIPISMWGFLPPVQPGCIRVLGHLPGVSAVAGQGYLAQIRFDVVGTAGQSSPLTLSSLSLYNNVGDVIPCSLASGAVSIVAVPLEIVTLSLPQARTALIYSATLEAQGGQGSRTWNASGLPSGLTLSTSGVISGQPLASGNFNVSITVADSSNPPFSVSRVISLQVVLSGDANSDGLINMADVTKVERMILGLDPLTPGADVNFDGEVNMGDVTRVEMKILGL